MIQFFASPENVQSMSYMAGYTTLFKLLLKLSLIFKFDASFQIWSYVIYYTHFYIYEMYEKQYWFYTLTMFTPIKKKNVILLRLYYNKFLLYIRVLKYKIKMVLFPRATPATGHEHIHSSPAAPTIP